MPMVDSNCLEYVSENDFEAEIGRERLQAHAMPFFLGDRVMIHSSRAT